VCSMRLICLAFALVLSGCPSIPEATYPTSPPGDEGLTILGPSDRVEVAIYNGAKEVARNPYTLDESGTISLQFIGDYAAGGKSPTVMRKEIHDKLLDGYLVNPIVSVTVLEINSRKVSVSGEVIKDGTIRFVPGMSIVEAIAQSGGFTPMAQKNDVRVTRTLVGNKDKTYVIPVEAIQSGHRPNFPLAPGDRIFVPERIF
jgi:protein involved in polysaccharide export with SLBB domain